MKSNIKIGRHEKKDFNSLANFKFNFLKLLIFHSIYFEKFFFVFYNKKKFIKIIFNYMNKFLK